MTSSGEATRTSLGTPTHVTGNPRGDTLRPEMKPYFEAKKEEYRSLYGDFFLINTNFSMVNSSRELFLPATNTDGTIALGYRAFGMTRAFAERLDNHKRDIFEHFLHMIPELVSSFPVFSIVIRRHPSENPQVYHRRAGACERIHLAIESNVIPWLLAARATIHNG